MTFSTEPLQRRRSGRTRPCFCAALCSALPGPLRNRRLGVMADDSLSTSVGCAPRRFTPGSSPCGHQSFPSVPRRGGGCCGSGWLRRGVSLPPLPPHSAFPSGMGRLQPGPSRATVRPGSLCSGTGLLVPSAPGVVLLGRGSSADRGPFGGMLPPARSSSFCPDAGVALTILTLLVLSAFSLTFAALSGACCHRGTTSSLSGSALVTTGLLLTQVEPQGSPRPPCCPPCCPPAAPSTAQTLPPAPSTLLTHPTP